MYSIVDGLIDQKFKNLRGDLSVSLRFVTDNLDIFSYSFYKLHKPDPNWALNGTPHKIV
jgi:hypothetical protein